MTEAQGRHPFLLSTASPSRRQRRMAVTVLAVPAGAMLLSASFARLDLPGTEILIPAYAAAAFLVEVLTSALLFAIFSIDRSRAVLLLATAYLLSGLLVIPWALTFPGVFTALGLDASIQVTPVIAAGRRLGFALLVLGYALTRDEESRDRAREPRGRVIAGRIALVVAATSLLVLVAVRRAEHLPTFMRDAREVAPLWQVVPAASVALYLTGLSHRPRNEARRSP